MESARYMADITTAANLLFGAMSIFLSLAGKYIPAAWMIFFSIIFDIADGKIARLSSEFSEFGKQFDSLADLVSFVVAPAILVFAALPRPHFFLWQLLVCLVAIFCGAFRLARFNTEAEDKIAVFFNGLPTPGFGGSCAALVLIFSKYNLQVEPRITSVVIAILAMLMVSQIKYPTFKDISLFQWKYLISLVIILALLFVIPELVVFLLFLVYVVVMPIRANRAKGENK